MRSQGKNVFPLFLSIGISLFFVGWLPLSSGDVCPTCRGRGVIEATCPVCGGLGYFQAGFIHGQPAAYGCEACGGVRGDPSQGTGRPGTGRISQECPDCGGSGQVASPSSTQPQPQSAKTAAAKAAAESKAKQAEFEKFKQETLQKLKGVSRDEPKPLEPNWTIAVNLDAIQVQAGVVDSVDLRGALLQDFSKTILERTCRPNGQAQEVLRSFKMKEPPSPIKNIADLAAGDVILVAPWAVKDRNAAGYVALLESNGINWLDRWGSDNWSSPASHTALYLGERNGRRWYLDHTLQGPVIMEESAFLKEYGARGMDVATLVGQPLSRLEGDELWKAAHELGQTIKYGPSKLLGNDRMVCSEAARWALVRAGRRVPETRSGNAKILGMDSGLNKKNVVDFSPSDFYENQQYFLVHRLGIRKK